MAALKSSVFGKNDNKTSEEKEGVYSYEGVLFLREGVVKDMQLNSRGLAEMPEITGNNRIFGVIGEKIPLFLSFCQFGDINSKFIHMMYGFDNLGKFYNLEDQEKFDLYDIPDNLLFLSYHLKLRVYTSEKEYFRFSSLWTLHSNKDVEDYEGQIDGEWMKFPQQNYYIQYELTYQVNKGV